MVAHSDKPTHFVGPPDQASGFRRTACGRPGLRGMLSDELVCDGATLRVVTSWRFVTCPDCRAELAKIASKLTPTMVHALCAVGVHSDAAIQSQTLRALRMRGLITKDEAITDLGAAVAYQMSQERTP